MSKPIRILQVFGELNRGGAETMIMEIYKNIDRTKVQFDFLVHTDKKCDFDDEVLSLGGKIYQIPKYTVKNHLEYKKSVNEFFNIHKEFQVVHSHIRSTASIILNIAKNHGLKTIAHSHSISNGSGFSNKIKDIIQIPLKNNSFVDKNIACSDIAGKWLFGTKDFTVLKNGIDIKKFKFDNNVRFDTRDALNVNDKFVVGHVGRFDKDKNQSFVLSVFEELSKVVKDAILIFVGDGITKNTIETQVEAKGLKDKVLFLGKRDDINKLMMSMDVFIFPSKYEGLGIVLIEAQATGLHCLASDKVIPKEVNVSDVFKYVSLNDDPSQWAYEILNLDIVNDRCDMNEQVNENGYNINSTSNRLTSIYNGLINH